jgi:hypothetical protein
MFDTPYNERIRQGCLALDRRKIDNMLGIESGDSFESGGMKGSSYGGEKMMDGGNRHRHRNTREEEYKAVEKMDILPQNTNLPRGNSVSSLNSKLYLPIKQSGSFQTPATVLQFYHDGGIQGAGKGEADIEKVEGGAMLGGDRNVVEDLSGRMSELSGFGMPSMKRLLGKLKKKLKGGAWYDSLFSGLSTVAKHLPAILEHAPKVIDGVKQAKSFLGFGVGGKKLKVLKTEMLDKLADMGAGEYDEAGSFSKMLGGLMPVDLSSKADFLLDEKRGKGKRGRKIGGYDINIIPPLGVIEPIEDLRGTMREGAGKKKRVKKVKKVAVVGGEMSKAKMRGLAVSKLMKEKGLKLGEASKQLASMERKHGAGFWDDFASGFSSVVEKALPLLPLLL